MNAALVSSAVLLRDVVQPPIGPIETPDPRCPSCGAARNEWVEGGILVKGVLYCCEGCAAGRVCVCGTFDLLRALEDPGDKPAA